MDRSGLHGPAVHQPDLVQSLSPVGSGNGHLPGLPTFHQGQRRGPLSIDLDRDGLAPAFAMATRLSRESESVIEWAEEWEDIHDFNFFTKKKPIIDEFERGIKRLHVQWSEFDSAIRGSNSLPPEPSTIFDILYKDITKKSKIIALSAMFGHDHMAMIKEDEQHIRKRFREQGKSEKYIEEQIRIIQKTTQNLLSAQDPDHCI